MNGVTLDTGALIGLERRSERMKAVLTGVHRLHLSITIPASVIAEWFRGQGESRRILALAKHIEPLSPSLAEIAGKALATTGGNNSVDAIVMASAAQRGDHVFTADIDHLNAFRSVFPNVRVFGV